MRSCSLSVLMEESTEQVASTHGAWFILPRSAGRPDGLVAAARAPGGDGERGKCWT